MHTFALLCHASVLVDYNQWLAMRNVQTTMDVQQSVGLADVNGLSADKGAAQAVDVCECGGQPTYD